MNRPPKSNYLALAITALAFATVCHFTVRAADSRAYTITSLSLPPAINDTYGNQILNYEFAYPTAINAQGQISGTVGVYSDFFFVDGLFNVGHPFLWQAGVMTDLAPLTDQGYPASYGSARGINDAGAVVGSTTVDYVEVAMVWQDGVPFLLEPEETIESSGGLAINQLGHVVGFSAGRAVIWHDGIKTDLGGDFIYATGINDADQVCGQIYTSNSYSALVWQDGVRATIPALGADAGSLLSYAVGINASGYVVGQSSYADDTYHGFVWHAGATIDLGVLGVSPAGYANSIAWAINDHGQVVGDSATAAGGTHGFLWRDANGNGASDPGEMVDLNTLLPPNSGWEIYSATGINSRGQIVGHGIFAGADRAFVMTPPASPAELVQILGVSVTTLVQSGVSPPAGGQSLLTKLAAAQQSAIAGNATPAINQLNAFINQVKAFVNSRKLTAAQGQTLIDAAQAIIAALR